MPLGDFTVEAHVADGRGHLALRPALHIEGRIAVVLEGGLLVGVHEVELSVVLPLGDMHQDEATILHKCPKILELCLSAKARTIQQHSLGMHRKMRWQRQHKF